MQSTSLTFAKKLEMMYDRDVAGGPSIEVSRSTIAECQQRLTLLVEASSRYTRNMSRCGEGFIGGQAEMRICAL